MNNKGIKEENKFIKISAEKIKKIRKNIKVGILVATSGILLTSFTGCSGCSTKAPEEETSITSEVNPEDQAPVAEANEEQPADQKVYTLQDNAAIAANNALKVGIDLSYDGLVDENDVDTYAKQFTNYLIVTNRDDYNDMLFAEMMIGSNVSADDLIQSFMEVNTAFKKHIITVTNSNLYDFNNLYNENDAEILNNAQSLIATMNEKELKSDARKEAAKEFYSYTTDILTSTNAKMALSPEALDTLVTFVEAYDELTKDYEAKKIKGAYVDDELEHFLNISKESCFGEAADQKLGVEDQVVENLKSLFRTHTLRELEDKYAAAREERALQLQLGNELNESNSYAKIIEYVRGLINIDNYKAVKYDYYTWLLYVKGIQNLDGTQIVTTTGQTGKLVSNGKGGYIDPASLNKYGVQTDGKTDEQIRTEYEKKVQEAENKKSEENKKVTIDDETGKPLNPNNVVDGTVEDVQNGYAAGYAAGQSGAANACPAGVSEAYRNAYANGYAAGAANKKAMEDKYKGEEQKYEPAPSQPEVKKEEVKTEDYKPAQPAEQPKTPAEQPSEQPTEPTKPVIPLPELEEEFVPVEEEIIDQTEEIKTVGALDELRYYRAILTNLPTKELTQTTSFRI
ncbi:MAG: hypothetical protein IKN87_05215 [Bacilli bacterium]|nr:hypothetical protein [Bacilli bacterium]